MQRQKATERELCTSSALNHAWNIVYIDGKAYHVDVTWDDPVYSTLYGYSVENTGYIPHDNFLRSNDGIQKTGHRANDYSASATSTKYDDNAIWSEVRSQFCLVEDEIYYIKNNSITRYSDQKPIFEIETRYESFLATDGEKLYYSDGSAIYSLEPATMKTEPEPEPEPEDLKGDVNGNGKIDAQDYMLAKRHCLRTYVLVDEMAKRGDINGNGSIEASEYALIKRHYLGTFVII